MDVISSWNALFALPHFPLEEDDSSLSSTVSAVSPCSRKETIDPATTPSSQGDDRRHNRVCFDEESNEYHENTWYTHDEISRVFYSAEDCERFRYDFWATAAFVQKSERVCRNPAFSITDILSRTYKACCEKGHLTRGQEVRLQQMFRIQRLQHTVGLESQVLCLVDEMTPICGHRQLLQTVHALQHEMQWSDENALSQALRIQCEKISSRSHLFAHYLAKARWEAGR